MSKILFVSNLKAIDDNMTSTDVMTLNIIKGIKECGESLDLFILYDKSPEIEKLSSFYKAYCDNMFFLKRVFHPGQSKFKTVFGSLFYQLFDGRYKKAIKKAGIRKSYDLIISNKITIDEIIVGKLLKKMAIGNKHYEYWSDPMALSGINEAIFRRTPRRWAFKVIESKAIGKCDRIIYGTETLLSTQKHFFPRKADKMSYVNVSYCDGVFFRSHEKSDRIIYAGNYYSTIRNINELIQAVSSQKKYKLDVYGDGDLLFPNAKNVCFHKRISKKDLDIIQNEYNIQICLLNANTPQIPGKVFYDMMSKKSIIVLTDGPMKEEIIDYLNKYRRFIVCENKKEKIEEILAQSLDDISNIDYDFLKENFSPKSISRSLIDGGIQ